MLVREEIEEPGHRKQQCLRIAIVQVGPARKSAQIISKQYPRDRSLKKARGKDS